MSETDETQTPDEAESVETARKATAAEPAREGERAGFENLRVLENIEVELTVVVGSAEMKIRDLLRLNEGSVSSLTDWLVIRLIFSPMAPLSLRVSGHGGRAFRHSFFRNCRPGKTVENI